MTRTTADLFLRTTQLGGNVYDLNQTAGASQNTNTRVTYAVGGTSNTRRFRPLATNGVANPVPSVGTAPANEGWRESVSQGVGDMFMLASGDIDVRLRCRRSGQALEVNQNSDTTVIVYETGPHGEFVQELGRATTRFTWTTTITERTFTVTLGSAVTLGEDSRLQIEVYVQTLDALNNPAAPAVATELWLVCNASSTDSRFEAIPNHDRRHRRQPAEVSAAPFNPLSVSGCKFWFSADNLAFADGAQLNGVRDQSGLGNDLYQHGATEKPSLKTNILNGLPVVRFDAGPDYLFRMNGFLTGTSGSVFMVIQFDTIASVQIPFASSDEASATRFVALQYDNTSGNLRIVQQNADTNDIVRGSTTVAADTWYVVEYSSTGTAYGIRLDNVAETLTVVAGADNGDWFGDVTGLDNVTMGAGIQVVAGAPIGVLDGDIAELLVYDGVSLSTTDRNNIFNYLAAKWNVSTFTRPVNDVVTRTYTGNRAITETVTGSDAVSRSGSGFIRSVGESVTAATDAITRVFNGARNIAQSVSGTDAVTRVFAGARTVTESVTGTDAVSRIYGAVRNIAQTITTATDTVTRVFSANRTITETLSAAADSVARMLVQARGISETTGPATDSVARGFTGTRPISESVTGVDVVARQYGGIRSISETIPATTDAVARAFSGTRIVAESAPANDGVARQYGGVRVVEENIGPEGGGSIIVVKKFYPVFDEAI